MGYNNMSKIVETDNVLNDYPDEKFTLGFRMSKEGCKKIADLINYEVGPNSSRYWKVVDDDYVLVPGFEA